MLEQIAMLQPVDDPLLEQENSVKSGRDEAAWTDRNPHSPSPCTARWGGGGKRVRSEVEPGRTEGKGEDGFSFLFLSISLSYPIFKRQSN